MIIRGWRMGLSTRRFAGIAGPDFLADVSGYESSWLAASMDDAALVVLGLVTSLGGGGPDFGVQLAQFFSHGA
ncbi:MAG: hypothetical protein EA424_09205 [Planctomycetaceae bacterium]|nr:MAG: hypothetical protein EA424_09205 [Planctomycetaceae bacterium]